MRAFAEEHPDAVFVEIGANDGAQHDPLRPIVTRYPWRGVMVEPVPYVFKRLRTNYGGRSGIALENAAIADRNGRLPFYHLREAAADERAHIPDWYDGIGSFSRETLLSHAREIPDIAERVEATDVRCLTFDSLCEKHGLTAVDVVLIDTEGYDWEVLKGIDLDRWSPDLVVFEHYHLGKPDVAEAGTQLSRSGYELLAEGFDTWCLGPGASDAVRRVWRRLRPAVPPAFAADELTSDGGAAR